MNTELYKLKKNYFRLRDHCRGEEKKFADEMAEITLHYITYKLIKVA
jgi:hypothetical protein